MSMFDPDIPRPKPWPKPKSGEKGSRGTRYSTTTPEMDAEQGKKRRVRLNDPLDVTPHGFIVGSGTDQYNSRWYYDGSGHYVRVRGRKRIVERFGPRRALAQLTEDERAQVMNARRRAARAEKQKDEKRSRRN